MSLHGRRDKWRLRTEPLSDRGYVAMLRPPQGRPRIMLCDLFESADSAIAAGFRHIEEDYCRKAKMRAD